MILTLQQLYVVAGLMFGSYAVINACDRTNPKRWGNFSFWGIYALSFLLGDVLPKYVLGAAAVVLALIAGFGGLGKGAWKEENDGVSRERSARRWGNRLFIPALLIPLVTFAGSTLFKYTSFNGQPVVQPKDASLVSLGLGTVVALAVALVMLRENPMRAIRGARRTMDAVSWAAILPQMLAALGLLFAAAGVGTEIARLVQDLVPLDTPLSVVITYNFGMALFTIIMGNAFAAFPVMTAGFGLPMIVHTFHGNPAIMGAIGMLSGFCGTLMTPMAANFNIVPAALLELRDKHAVIKAQIPTAVLLLCANTVLMYCLVYSVSPH
jgi:uncharacterized membrane protein